ncbi:hypothetical protein I317_05352 [Kwoniella heveanensis CBS 569]|uniref:HMG box domain-containing protein n=1 Tax=Kwoniella heveanensis BCC8398 TaxID=1296120 RepID=A0A1B9H3L0_9TREE|nr:hypothetical protein I316_00071 [Kwoniella heveanensis BCC8398]OCF40817.1 hypothetical protein I317_05352 [Kwoniella heveanensis CBS 569]
MSAPTYEEMEAKRQEMIASFREIAAAMTRCVQVIEDYTALTPAHLQKPDFSNLAHNLALLPNGQLISDAALKKERKKKDKKPKDPNAPKRPPSAYILFQNEIREDVRNSNPGMSYKDILVVISQKWKELTDAQKKVYEDAYSNAHNNYVAEEKAYSAKPLLNASPAIDPALTDDTSDSDDSDDDTPPVKSKPISLSHPHQHQHMPMPPQHQHGNIFAHQMQQVPVPMGMQHAHLPPTPNTLHAATATIPPGAVQAQSHQQQQQQPVVDGKQKKEKKRKNKEDETVVNMAATGVPPVEDKKRKKRSKD